MTDLPPGAVLAGYRIDGLAGHGGMGVVYRATDMTLDRPVALKVIADSIAGDEGFRKRFITESRTAASLDHPNVVPIFHAGEQEGSLFLVMRYVERDLRTELAALGRLDPGRAVRIVAQVAAALDAAHARGLVHRDVKPANVLLSDSDHAYLSDFGLSKRAQPDADETKTGQLLGTLNYVAPEQIRGGAAVPQTDIYALGCVLFHAVTGRVPFPLENEEAKLWAHVSEPPPAATGVVPELPKALDAVLAKAMAKEPEARFETAGALADAAAAALQPGQPDVARPAMKSNGPGRGALVASALLDPFNLAVLGAMLAAGIVLGVAGVVVPAAIVIYLAAAARSYFDDDQRTRVAARESERQRRRVEEARKKFSPDAFAPPIAELLSQALEREQRIRTAIARADMSYSEVSEEVDRFLMTMRQTAARAELLHEGLEDAPPDAIAARLEGLREGGSDRRQLIEALTHQLDVQREMEVQLQRFYDQMEEVLVELDVIRGHVITATATHEPGDQDRLAADVRSLRDDMGEVAAGMAAAYEDSAAVHPGLA